MVQCKVVRWYLQKPSHDPNPICVPPGRSSAALICDFVSCTCRVKVPEEHVAWSIPIFLFARSSAVQVGLCYLQKIPADPTRNGICKIPFLFSNRSCLNEGFVLLDTTFSEFDLLSRGLQTKSLTRPVFKGTWRACRMIYPKFSFSQVKRGAGWMMLPAENTSWPNHTVFVNSHFLFYVQSNSGGTRVSVRHTTPRSPHRFSVAQSG